MTNVSFPFTILILVVVFLATVGWIIFGGESLSGPPGTMGDDVYFENIAFHLANNEGVKFDFTDRDWQQPYRESNNSHQNDWILILQHRGLTTSRSPGFPLVVSLTYRLLGRQFAAVRILNVIVLAGSISLLLYLVSRFHGYLVGTIALITISLDYFVLRTAGQFMSEALGTAIICLLFSACIGLSHISTSSNRWRWFAWLVIGLLFGVGSLVRANLNAWFLIIIASLAATVVWRVIAGQTWQPLLRNGVCFGVGVILIASPWWIRNCQVTGGFAPFGTSGSFGLVGGYCDQAYASFGNWSLDASVAAQQQTMNEPGFFDLPLAQQEFLMGKHSSSLALSWMSENWTKLPALMGMKAISHLGFYRQPIPILCINGLLFFGAMIGFYATRRTTGFWFAVFLLLSVITTSLTWPHYGRYSLPLRPLIHVACAIGTVVFWAVVLRCAGYAVGPSQSPAKNNSS